MPAVCRDCGGVFEGGGEACPACGSVRLIAHPELLDLSIAHIDCDAFYASVEKRDDPTLADKPVIVGHPGGRGVVTTACYVARKFGPRSAMPMFKALELCPQAVVIPPDIAKYKRVSGHIRALFAKATPLFEPLSLDEAYLDLSEGVRLVDRPPAVLLVRLARAIETRVGITVSVGLSYNKYLAKLASDRDKPRGFSVIGRAEAKAVLAQLPVRSLWGVGAATAARMAEQGITMVAQLQAMPEAEMSTRWGKFGRQLAGFVQGIDHRRITSDRPAKSVSTETTFARDIRERAALERELRPLAEGVAHRLARHGAAGRTVVLKMKTSDFTLITRHHRLSDATGRADVILAAGLLLLERLADGRAFRLIGIGVTDLCPIAEADPPDLFGRQLSTEP
ncbi:DNA polymerase IV [Paramagnetospirillum kuznetsovii]|uniref:DNA polymerase IV n=1 Tax=Paramagnetospirillum kuznetsovii TaxID=2053833 RepID=A0A364NTE8_9PROT|nr:DNA polymerase IV [Paramagnetospirillum kuznetsovii]RAU20348.1 DNA polymerase IV [Paramagnetospirillum kuznetsovii]